MGLRNIIFNAVSQIDGITKDLQGDVQHFPWIGQGGDGTPQFDNPRVYKAIVTYREIERKTTSGEIVLTNAYLCFIQPIQPHGAPDRTEPVDPRDMFVCPDGTSGVPVSISGFMDSATGKPYFSEIYLTKYLRTLSTQGG